MSSIHVVWNLIVVIIFILSPSSIRSKNKDPTPYYDVCAPFGCGGINFTFPFSDRSTFGSHRLDCGLPGDFLVSCDPSLNQPSVELVPGRFYQIKEIFPASSDRLVTVVDVQLMKDLSLPLFSTSYNSCSVLKDYLDLPGRDIAGNTGLYLSSGTVTALNFWICDPQVTRPGNILFIANSTCNEVSGSGDNRQLNVYVWISKNTSTGSSTGTGDPPPKGCRLVQLPVLNEVIQTLSRVLSSDFSRALDGRFTWETVINVMKEFGVSLAWSLFPKCDECQTKNGRCGFEAGNDGVVCFYEGTPGNDKWKIIVGVTIGCLSLVILVSFAYHGIKKRRRESSINHDHVQTNYARTKDAQQFIKSYQSTLLTSFSFKDIRKITNGFKEKLGEGGYGSVYKGKLPDGRVVAVKLLDKASERETPHNSQDFINEVRTIGTIHHVNIIRLHGFCVDHARQALIYEFMPNGSLGDVLRSEGYPSLGTDVMMKIALGVAEGVNYLHQGCDSRILHLDIKPQNVLLDKGYNPKVSDFGLAKVYSRSRSTISMSAVKGTIGFIAPEIIMRNLGNPSDRSDVYSFGMVLLEMIGARKRVNKTSASSSSTDKYFPDWIYEELNRNECGDTEIVDNGEDISFVRKMIMVGLWCIQINPRERPPMTRVLEMLSGKVESIPMPPKPLFFASSKNLLRIDETESDTEIAVVSSLDESR